MYKSNLSTQRKRKTSFHYNLVFSMPIQLHGTITGTPGGPHHSNASAKPSPHQLTFDLRANPPTHTLQSSLGALLHPANRLLYDPAGQNGVMAKAVPGGLALWRAGFLECFSEPLSQCSRTPLQHWKVRYRTFQSRTPVAIAITA